MTRFMLHLRRFGVRMTADKKRFAMLCLVTAIGLLFWTRLIVVKRIGRTAMAEQATAQIASNTPQDAQLPAVTVILPDRPTRDPFAIDADVYPAVEDAGLAVDATAGTPSVDPRQALQGMSLEASMPPAFAVIDGVTRRRNDRVPGSAGVSFQLIEINQRSVVLLHGEDRYVLRMEYARDR